MDMSQYRDLFVTEAREHIHTMGELISSLSKGSQEREEIDSLFRMAHSVKGMAAAMGYQDTADLAHRMEDVMDRVRKGVLAFDSGPARLLQEGADVLESMVDDIERDGISSRQVEDLVRRLQECAAGETPALQEEPAPVPSPEPLPAVPQGTRGGRAEARQQTVRVRTTVLDSLIDLTGELVTTKYRLIDSAAGIDAPRLHAAIADLSRLVRELQDEVSSARLIPFSALAARFPRAVRDLSRSRDKEVVLEVEGGNMELDRGSLEGLADPLIHLLRNAIDHGIEPPQVRQLAGKPFHGTLRLTAERGNGQFTVVLEDDGRGMDPAKLIEIAIERDIVTSEEGWSMTAEQAFMLTCHPGFSTASEVTDVSGRGVGMDAARAGIQALGGHFFIESAVGKGTRMIIRLPLTVAIVNVLLVEIGGVAAAIPVSSVLRTVEAWRTTVAGAEGSRSFRFEGEPVPLVELHRLVGAPSGTSTIVSMVVADVDGRRIGFSVDRFVGQQEVYVKPLGRPLERLAGLSGSAMLGDGRILFLLDLVAIARLAGC